MAHVDLDNDPSKLLSLDVFERDERVALLTVAASQIDVKDPEPYFRDAAPCYTEGAASGKQWCQIFLLWCLRRRSLCDWEWEDVKGFLYRLPTTQTPGPSDLACFPVNKWGNPVWHGCMVEMFADFQLTSIDGNTGGKPGIVARKSRDIRIYQEPPIFYATGGLISAMPQVGEVTL